MDDDSSSMTRANEGGRSLATTQPRELLEFSILGLGLDSNRTLVIGAGFSGCTSRTLVVESLDAATCRRRVPLQPAVMPPYIQAQYLDATCSRLPSSRRGCLTPVPICWSKATRHHIANPPRYRRLDPARCLNGLFRGAPLRYGLTDFRKSLIHRGGRRLQTPEPIG